jgi:ketosteroid isomerase-like protein
MSSPEPAVSDWLREFEAACRERDFAAGRRLFASDALAFGTYAVAVRGIENIEGEQWRNVWPRIREFRFESAPTVQVSGDSAWIAAGWVVIGSHRAGWPALPASGARHVRARPARRPLALRA